MSGLYVPLNFWFAPDPNLVIPIPITIDFAPIVTAISDAGRKSKPKSKPISS